MNTIGVAESVWSVGGVCVGGQRKGQRYVGSVIATNVQGAWGTTSAGGASETSCSHSNSGV